MHLMNPQGAFALLSLLAIVILYILKQRLVPRAVSSTYLWQKAVAQMEASRPFQKLRRNLLFFLQLLLALLLSLSVMRPMTVGDGAGEAIFLFDLSASMQADAGDGSRLDIAIRDAQRRIDGFADGTRVSVLTAGSQVQQVLFRTADHAAARQTIEGLTAQNGGADISGALSLSLALQKELTAAQLVCYTDQKVDAKGIVQPAIFAGADNRSVLSLGAGGTVAIARIANHGAPAEITVECYADDTLCDVRTVFVAEGGVESVQFDVPERFARLTATITDKDALPADNTRYFEAHETAETTVVLAGRDNIFLEKALSLRPDMRVLKTTPDEAAQVVGAALTVLDGPLPEVLPQSGALLLIDPDQHVGARESTPATLSAATGDTADGINGYLQVDQIQVARYAQVSSGTPLWMAGDAPVLSLLQDTAQPTAVLSFDLHDSNLPVLPEFPLFIQRLLQVLVPEPLGGAEDASCGESIPIAPQSFAQEAIVRTPSGREIRIDEAGTVLTDTNEIGIYTLQQTDTEGTVHAYPFALHIPNAESDLRTVHAADGDAMEAVRDAAYGREWTALLISLALLLLLIEWWVIRRGY